MAYNSALANWEFAKGTIMAYNNVVISEGALPEAVQVRAVEHERQRSLALTLRERPAQRAYTPQPYGQGTQELPGVYTNTPNSLQNLPSLPTMFGDRPGLSDGMTSSAPASGGRNLVPATPAVSRPGTMPNALPVLNDHGQVGSLPAVTEGGRPATAPSSVKTEMFAALERAQQRVFPDAVTLPIMVTGATDSAQLRAKGVEAYGLGNMATEDDRTRVHGNDERTSIEGLGKFVELMWWAVTDVAAKK